MKDFAEFSSDVYTLPATRPALGRRPVLRFYGHTGKRICDVVLSGMALVIFAPVILLLWAMIRLDGGPGFYTQTRVGRNGRRFHCWKLRTMIVDAESALERLCEKQPLIAQEWRDHQKLHKDPRITRVGAFLRASSLDEIPQIWNVFRGDMSIVGPRPFMDGQKNIYDSLGSFAYYSVRPGITGPWQVYGRSKTLFADRVPFDVAYCHDIRFWTDMALILKTCAVIFRRTGR